MQKVFIEERVFEKADYSEIYLSKGEYEHCTFIDCNFSGCDLSNSVFTDCEFKNCNLTSVKLSNTALRNVKFTSCKTMGIHFENCNEFLFAVSFSDCILDLSCFYRKKMKKAVFRNCRMHETDLTEADLSGAHFDNCDLLNASFDQTILEKADMRTSRNYIIDPENARIKKARFSSAGIAGLLAKYDIEIS